MQEQSIRTGIKSTCSKPFFRHDRYNAAEFDPIAQNVLINFVRNVPSTLVWFRSDLSTENIRMLQLERPGIELVN